MAAHYVASAQDARVAGGGLTGNRVGRCLALTRTGAGEAQFLLFAVGQQVGVDELASVVGMGVCSCSVRDRFADTEARFSMRPVIVPLADGLWPG